jgi:hypothetical protein
VAETYWPFDAGSGASSGEDRWYQMAPLWALDGVTATAGLAVTTLSGRNLQVAVGSAWVHGAYYLNDAAKSLAIAANATGNPRIDRIVLRRDLSANTVVAAVVQGTAAASPTVPALTQVATGIWEVALAQYRAETGFVNTDPLKLTDERRVTGAAALDAQSVRVFASAADRTIKVPSPTEGMLTWLADSDRFEFYDGAAWRQQSIASTVDVTTNQSTTSTSYADLATVGPAVSLVLASGQKALINVSARAVHSAGGTQAAVGSFAVSGAATIAAADVDGFETNALTTTTNSRATIFTAGATGTFTFTMKYKVINGGTGSFFNRRISAVALG